MTGKNLLKHIGMVGCSAEGAALCYKTICTQSSQKLGLHAHPEISMHTPSMAKYVKHLDNNNLQGIADLMLNSAKKLKMIGADFLICPDNTIHRAFDLVQQDSPLPWLHIADTVVASAKQRGFKKLAILGTQWLVESDVYPDKIAAAGLEWLRPGQVERIELSRIIMHELVYSQFETQSISYFQKVVENLKAAGCDAVILGCTEIPLIINDANSALPTLDSNWLLAEAAIDYAIKGESLG